MQLKESNKYETLEQAYTFMLETAHSYEKALKIKNIKTANLKQINIGKKLCVKA